MAEPLLSGYLEPVWTCSLQTCLADLLRQALEGNLRYWIAVDQANYPLGALPLERLLAQVGRCLPWLDGAEQADGKPDLAADLQQPLQDYAYLLGPLQIIQSSAVEGQTWLAHLRNADLTQPWVLVDDQNRLLGALAKERLVQDFWRPLEDSTIAAGLSASAGKGVQDAIAPPISPSTPAHSPRDLRLESWLTTLSHELKSPLTSLLGLSSLLSDSRLGTLSERQRHYVSILHQTVRQLNTTVNRLLDWVRLESGQITLTPAPITVEALQQTIFDLLTAQAQRHRQSLADVQPYFSLSIAADVGAVFAAPQRLQQMLEALLGNVLQHTEQGTRFGLRIERWGSWLGLTVWDQGQGIAADQQPQFFQSLPPQPFAQSQRLGLRLGLPMTWQLAHLHGGGVTFTSSACQGTQFTLLLPDRPSPTTTSQAEAEGTTEPPSGGLVLLLGTDLSVIDAVCRTLAPSNYYLVVARSPAEAFHKVHRLLPIMLLVHPESLAGSLALVGQLQQHRTIEQLPCLGIWDQLPSPQSGSALATSLAVSQVERQLLPLIDHLLQKTQVNSPRHRLTLLHLKADAAALLRGALQPSPLPLQGWLQAYHHRILEVDDLAQADLLARVWQPDVVIIDPAIPRVHAYFTDLAQHPALSRCPLITLTPAATAAALQYPHLQVFPCYHQPDTPLHQQVADLVKAIVFAAQDRIQQHRDANESRNYLIASADCEIPNF